MITKRIKDITGSLITGAIILHIESVFNGNVMGSEKVSFQFSDVLKTPKEQPEAKAEIIPDDPENPKANLIDPDDPSKGKMTFIPVAAPNRSQAFQARAQELKELFSTLQSEDLEYYNQIIAVWGHRIKQKNRKDA